MRSVITVVRTIDEGQEGFGLDKSGVILLHVLDHLGTTRPSAAASACHLDLSTVSRLLRALEESGLVERQRDPEDGRAHLVSLTSAGRRMLGEIDQMRVDVFRSALNDWPPAERDRLAETLARFADALVIDKARRTAGLTARRIPTGDSA